MQIALDLDRFRENLDALRAELEALASPTPGIVVITKYLSVDDVRVLADEGIGPRGENRSQALAEKVRDGDDPAGWHFVGHLQRNKVDEVLPRVGLLHSVDSERLARAIEKSASKRNVRARGLVQVNVSGEESKSGLTPDQARRLLPQWSEAFPHLELAGLMTMAPLQDAESCRPHFRALRELRDEIRAELPDAHAEAFRELSMGMSNDYRVAAEEGATWIRIGRALYE